MKVIWSSDSWKNSERNYLDIKKLLVQGNNISDSYSATVTDWLWVFIKLNEYNGIFLYHQHQNLISLNLLPFSCLPLTLPCSDSRDRQFFVCSGCGLIHAGENSRAKQDARVWPKQRNASNFTGFIPSGASF